MEPRPIDREEDPPEVFVFVPLTIPVVLTYAAFRYWWISLPIAAWIVLAFLVRLIPIVGVPLLVGSLLVTVWVVRIRRMERAEQDAWVEE